MAIGVVSAIYGLGPTSIAIALSGTASPVTPWPGWTAIHSTIGDVVYFPAQDWQTNSTTIASLELRRWTTASLAFIIFVLLGLTAEVKKMYWRPIKSAINQVFPSDQAMYDFINFHPMSSYPPTCSRTTFGKNTDENLSDHWKGGRLFWVSRTFVQQLTLSSFSIIAPPPEWFPYLLWETTSRKSTRKPWLE